MKYCHRGSFAARKTNGPARQRGAGGAIDVVSYAVRPQRSVRALLGVALQLRGFGRTFKRAQGTLGSVLSGDATENHGLAEVAAAVVHVGEDGTELTAAEQAFDGHVLGVENLGLGVVARTALGVEQRGAQFDGIERTVLDGLGALASEVIGFAGFDVRVVLGESVVELAVCVEVRRLTRVEWPGRALRPSRQTGRRPRQSRRRCRRRSRRRADRRYDQHRQ